MTLRIILLGLAISMLTSTRAQTKSGAAFDSLFQQAGAERNQGSFDKAIATYQSCLALATTLGDSLKLGNSLIGIGISYDQQGRFDSALEYYFKALGFYEKIDNKKKVGGTLKNIGNTYRVLKNYPKAAVWLNQALDLQLTEHDSGAVGNVLNDIGLLYMDQDSSARAHEYFNRIITGYGPYIRPEVRSYVLNNLALTLSQMHDYTQALQRYRESLDLMKSREDQYGIALVLGNMGDCYFRTHDYANALEYHLQNLAIVREIKSGELLKDSYDNLARTYQAMGNFNKAYEYAVLEMQIKDSVYQEQSARSLAEMEARYQNEKKQNEILQLQQNNRLTHIQLVNQRLVKYFLVGAILLIIVIAAIIYRNYLNKRRANLELGLVNAKLAEANQSKARLISIISHDLRTPVSSLFSFLHLKKRKAHTLTSEQLESMDKELTRSADNLLEAMEDILIWSKSQMEQFSPSSEKIELGALLDEIMRLHHPYADERSITLEKQQVQPIYLQTDPNFIRIIIRNLVGNAVKFTPPGGWVRIAAASLHQEIRISVKDNGPGMQPDDLARIFEWNSIRSDSSGLGLRLAREFAAKLGGDLTATSESGQGCEFILTLPPVIPNSPHPIA